MQDRMKKGSDCESEPRSLNNAGNTLGQGLNDRKLIAERKSIHHTYRGLTKPPAELETPVIKTRGSPSSQSPFVWMSRKALEVIAKKMGTQAINGYAVYLALARLSNERGNAVVIEEPIAVIASLASLRYRKTQEVLAELETVGVIKRHNPNPIKKRPGQPCSYSFIPFFSSALRAQPKSDTSARNAEHIGTGEQASRAVSPKVFLSKERNNTKAVATLSAECAEGAQPSGEQKQKSALPPFVGNWEGL